MPEAGPTLSDESKRAIEKAVLTANRHAHRYVGTEHLLSGLLQIDSPAVEAILTDQDVSGHELREDLETILTGAGRFPEITRRFELGTDPIRLTETTEKEETDDTPRPDGKTAALEFFAVELTDAKAQKKIDPVIGRDEEIDRLIQILCRRTKNNPVLLGEPGVGKTAIVEGLAKRIVEGDVPDVLRGKRIFSLDLGMMVAGTVYRGEFEGRIKQIIDEVKADPNIIVFIDELHNITGAGSTNGSMDLANILKPALARGELRCVGATTLAEYKKSIESDGALERRFQPIEVTQPSGEAAVGILKGLRPQYERWHGVKISDEAIEAAVTLSERYLTDRFLPDKAIDLIDEAAACLRVNDSRNRPAEKKDDLEERATAPDREETAAGGVRKLHRGPETEDRREGTGRPNRHGPGPKGGRTDLSRHHRPGRGGGGHRPGDRHPGDRPPQGGPAAAAGAGRRPSDPANYRPGGDDRPDCRADPPRQVRHCPARTAPWPPSCLSARPASERPNWPRSWRRRSWATRRPWSGWTCRSSPRASPSPS